MIVSSAADPAQLETQIVARVPCAAGSRLQFSWGLGAELRLCEIQNPATKLGGQEPAESNVVWSAPSAAHKVLSFAVAPYQSKLIQTSTRGQGSAADGGADAAASAVLEYSHKVLTALSEERDGDASGLVALEHAIWQLMEIFYVKAPLTEGFVAEDMAHWLEDNEVALSQHLGTRSLHDRLADALSSVRPDVLDDYWPCVRHLVAMGRCDDALSLLAAHDAMQMQQQCDVPSAMLPQFELLDALYVILRQMPRFRSSGSETASGREFDNMAEYLHYRASWQQQCRDLPSQCSQLFQDCADINDKTASGVNSVLSVLGGDEGDVAESASNWLELTVAELLHRHPNLKAQQHLQGLMQRCLQSLPLNPDGSQQILELVYNLLEAMVEGEVQRVVEVLSSSGAVSPWFMAHMYELMQSSAATRLGMCSSIIERPLPLFGGDQVEYWRLLFAETLMSHPSTWKLAVDYLAWCPLHGADAAEAFLEALPYGSASTRLVYRALHQCDQHRLAATANTISRIAGTCAWYDGRIGEAVRWLARARDERRLTVALEPALLKVEAALAANVGNYQARALASEADAELSTLLASISAVGSAAGTMYDGGASCAHAPPPSTASFLLGFMNLQCAVSACIQSQEDEAQAGTCDARLAHAAVRDSFMSLVGSNAVPKRIVPTLLFSMIPFLETDGCMPFSTSDVQRLIKWLSTSMSAPTSMVNKSVASASLHERHSKDVRLALARGLARAHVYEGGRASERSNSAAAS